MNRPMTALIAALEALLVVGLSIGIVLIPLSAVWAIQYGLQPDWMLFWRTAAGSWLIGHGVDFTFHLSSGLAPGLEGLGEPFRVSIAALGFALLTLLLAARTGRRLASLKYWRLALWVCSATFLALSLGLTLSVANPSALPSRPQGVLLPTAVFVFGLIIGVRRFTRSVRASRPESNFFRSWWLRQPHSQRAVLIEGVRAGLIGVLALIASSALVLAVVIGLSFAKIVALYEAIHGEVIGGISITLGELLLLPNFVIWVASWIVGPGFAVGTGSLVSPLGTFLGPLPGLPVLGALPQSSGSVGFLLLLLPVAIAFFVGILARRKFEASSKEPLTPARVASLGAVIGCCAAATMSLLALASGGSAGPGRLAQVGPDAIQVLIWTFIEFAATATIGVMTGRARASK
ncbi:MAG: hypothetical protein IT191_03560 [Microbacteriaceae bacterium]|nr:hypothetical protein [Microbacteriaceae bacterium]